jgi:hypothetical protein
MSGSCGKRCSNRRNRRQRVPFEKKVHQCPHQWTGAPTDGQGAPLKKKAGIRWKEPASRRTPASHERCERGKGRKKEDSVVREVRSRQNKVSEDMSDSYVLTSFFAVLSPSFSPSTVLSSIPSSLRVISLSIMTECECCLARGDSALLLVSKSSKLVVLVRVSRARTDRAVANTRDAAPFY